MNIIPAIDLYDNKCVRLKQGDFEDIKQYPINPLECAHHFVEQGATKLHIVDLEGAYTGSQVEYKMIYEIKKVTSLTIQYGGGLRNEKAIADVLDNDIDRVVIGSLSVTKPELISSLINHYGIDRFVLAFDIMTNQNFQIAIKGWREKSTVLLWDMLKHYSHFKNLRILCTDINRDGMLRGANNDLYQECVKRYPNFLFQASGGVGQLKDLHQLKKTGVSSVIVGKALYEGYFKLDEALREIALC